MDDDMIEAIRPEQPEDEPDDLLNISYAEPSPEPVQVEPAPVNEKTEAESVPELQSDGIEPNVLPTQPLDEPVFEPPVSKKVFEDVPPLRYWSEDKTEPLGFVDSGKQPERTPESPTQPPVESDAEPQVTAHAESPAHAESVRSEAATATPYDVAAEPPVTPYIEPSGPPEPVRSEAATAIPAMEPEPVVPAAENSKDSSMSEFDWSAPTPEAAETIDRPAEPESKAFEPRFVFDEPELLELSEPGERGFEISPFDKSVAGAEKPVATPEPSPELVAAVARLVVERLSDKVIREIAQEVVPRIAENLIREALEDEHSS
jgi:hypothetical protein